MGDNKSFKKTFGKIGLFLIFGIMVMNINLQLSKDIDNKSQVTSLSIKAKVTTANAEFFEDAFNRTMTAMTYVNPGFSAFKFFRTDEEGVMATIRDGAAKSMLFAFNAVLYGVLLLLSKLLLATAGLLEYGLDPDNFKALLESSNVYASWAAVRDILNLFFMLVLLFSAFATIFQVEKYHLKKVIIMLVVMALLVNFSYPISLFVIDFSNSIMALFVDSAFPGDASKSAAVVNMTGFGDSLTDSLGAISGSFEFTASVLLAIILTFIIFITILAFAVNLIIRIFALVILVIFAPAAFALTFSPQLKK